MLNEIGLKHGTDKATHHKYLDFYEKNLPDRSFSGRLLEVGVMDGASLRMWADYYPNAEIVGIDIDEPRDSGFSNAKWLKVDGTTPAITQLGKFDIILDDGSHMTKDQQETLGLAWGMLNKGGIYIMEDLHTSYNQDYINSDPTTAELLRKADWTFWQRVADDNTDSVTALKRKR